MAAPPPSKYNSSDKQTFDDIIRRKPQALIFRLHSQGSSQTLFRPNERVLVASLYRKKLEDVHHEELSSLLAEIEEKSRTAPEEASEAVEKHVTSWQKNNKDHSRFISLTCNVLYVFWEWKRRLRQRKGLQDDFIIIALKGSELQASVRAKLGTEWLQREEHKDSNEPHYGRRFSNSFEEVIVDGLIKSEAILGSISMSELEEFIPSWSRKLLEDVKEIPGLEKKPSFRETLPPEVDQVEDARARESLEFSLALLAPMLVPGKQQRTNDGDVVGCDTIDSAEQPIAEGASPKIDPRSGHGAVSGQRVAEDGKRSHSPEPEIESRLVGTSRTSTSGTSGDSPRQEPLAKRRRLSEKESTAMVGSANAGRDGQASVEPLKLESEYVSILATKVCRVRWKGREKFQKTFAFHGLELLKRYSNEIQSDEPKTLKIIMDEYEAWDGVGTS